MKAILTAAALIFSTVVPAPALSLDLTGLLKHPGFKADRTSITVLDAETGTLLASHQPDLKLNPASCMKVITAAATLEALGPDYRFQTDLYADRELEGGTVGTLYVHGTGDPMLVGEDLWRIARDLYDIGLRKITGDIVIDNSFFDSHEFPRKEGADHRAYTAKTSAVAVNFNSVSIKIVPAKRAGSPPTLAIDPPTDYFRTEVRLSSGGKYRLNISSALAGGRETITAAGSIPVRSEAQIIYRSVIDPVAHAGELIRFILRQNGIDATGAVTTGKTPHSAVGLVSEKSKPLAVIIDNMNKFSNNFIAEQVLKHLGAVRYGAPGSTSKGIRALVGYLSSLSIGEGSYTIENGSGLSDATLLSSMQLAKVLSAAYRDFAIQPEIVSSFSIFGVDGTMRKWNFTPMLKSRVRAKTGTLGSVSSLAGYVPMAGGRVAAFAILANGLPRGPEAAHKAELEVVRAISEETP